MRREIIERTWSEAIAGGLGRRLLAFVLGLFTVMSCAGSAHAWWNDDWSVRKKIVIDTSASGANISEPIGSGPIPVLVRLHSGNFRFGSAKEDGSDLRFVAGDDKTPLKSYLEKYDWGLGEALVWVSIPDLKPGAQNEIWLYYGNQKAVANRDTKGFYDADTVVVYHFSERGAPPQDSSVWANHALGPAMPADDALIGTGARFDGTNAVAVPATPSLNLADHSPLTWSAWIRMAAAAPRAILYGRREGSDQLIIGLDDGVPFVEVTNAGNVQRSAAGTPVAPGKWHYLAVVADGTNTTLYVDGSASGIVAAALPAMTGGSTIAANPGASPVPAAPPVSASPVAAAPEGGNGSSEPPATSAAPAPDVGAAPAADNGFAGDLDELRIAKVARLPGFIRLGAMVEGTDPSRTVLYLPDEEASNWFSGGYVGVILRSVTVDGWVVIGILVVMAAISWIVMVEKVRYLGRQGKANARFMKDFHAHFETLTSLDQEIAEETDRKKADLYKGLQRNSSLYRIYRLGAGEIVHRFANGNGDRILSSQAIAAIRAVLDSGYIKETQALNRLMVILTIAISGGPFLGLLGTVVGVMITFAAIAATGDVNINAIAPGIAAALVATVAGLAVAIPALFGYNYLITRITDLTSDMQAFIDQFVSRMAETYQSQAGSAHKQAAE